MILPPSLAELDKRQTFEQEAGFKPQLHHEQGSLKKWTGRIGTGGVWGKERKGQKMGVLQ